MSTQLEKGLAYRDVLRPTQEQIVVLEKLRRLLDAAQNPPPHGVADGSVGDDEYRELRLVLRAWDAMIQGLFDLITEPPF